MHEQEESVSGEIRHCLCGSPSDNMTSLKFIRVLGDSRTYYEESVTKNVLFILNLLVKKMLPARVNGRVQQNGQVIGHVQCINILACLRGFQD